MLIIKINPGENIERTLKRFKNKVRKTQQLQQLRNNQYFTKKSKKERDALAKAIYKNEYMKKREG